MSLGPKRPTRKIITIMHTICSSRNRWTQDEDGYDPVQAIKWVHESLSILENNCMHMSPSFLAKGEHVGSILW